MDTGLGSANSTTAGSGAAAVSSALSAHLRRVLVATAAEQNAAFRRTSGQSDGGGPSSGRPSRCRVRLSLEAWGRPSQADMGWSPAR